MTLRLLKWQFCQILSVFSSHAAFGALSKNYCIYDLWIPAAILVMDPLEFVAEEEKRRFWFTLFLIRLCIKWKCNENEGKTKLTHNFLGEKQKFVFWLYCELRFGCVTHLNTILGFSSSWRGIAEEKNTSFLAATHQNNKFCVWSRQTKPHIVTTIESSGTPAWLAWLFTGNVNKRFFSAQFIKSHHFCAGFLWHGWHESMSAFYSSQTVIFSVCYFNVT